MKNKPPVFRNVARNPQDEADRLNSDSWHVHEVRDGSRAATFDIGPATDAFPAAGSIAFTGFNVDNQDSFAFVVLENIAAGSVITFTDNEWSGTAFNTGEGSITLTVVNTLTAGTVISVIGAQAAGVTASTADVTVARSGGFDLGGTAESLFAYSGALATPTFLTVIGTGGFTGATTTGLLDNTGLTVGTNAIDLGAIDPDADIGAYNGARSGQASFTDYAAIVNNVVNWITQDGSGNQDGDGTAPDTPFPTTAFTVGAVTQPGQLSIGDVTLAEGDSGTTAFTFTVLRSGGDEGAVSATWTLNAPGGADLADSVDFDPGQLTSGTVEFADGETSREITVLVNGDTDFEDDETFLVTLSTPLGGATLGNANGTGTIQNDDAAPPVPGVLSINDVTLAEGDSGFTVFAFTITRSGGSDGQVAVFWTIDLPGGVGGADATDSPGALNGTAEFDDGVTERTILIAVAGDTTFEPDETFTVTLSGPVGGATLGDAVGTGTILNDDPAPAGTLSIDDVSLAEGDSGATTFTFTVTRAGGSAGAITADWSIGAPGGAGNADSADFVSGSVFSGQVSFADGETSKTITIDAQGDTVFEANELFNVSLTGVTGGALISDDTGVGTIQNDDVAPAAGSVSIGDVSIVEGNSGTSLLTFTLTRTGGAGAFDVNYATSNGGSDPGHAAATGGSDYVAASGTASFGVGQDTVTVSVTINGDLTPELSEEFTVTLANPTNGAAIGDGTAVGTITTDDAAPATTLIFSEDFTGFTGGFAPDPTASQLDSDIWRVGGFSDNVDPAYGLTLITGDFNRGTIGANDPTSGGVYTVTSNPALVVQPTGTEFETNGFIEARITNSSGSTATGFDVTFDWTYRNSGDRADSLTFSYSTDGTNFITVPAGAFTTPATLAPLTGTFSTQNEVLTLSGLNVENGDFIYLRWTHTGSAGSGNRDEVGIDNVSVSTTGGATGPLVSVSDVTVNEAAGTMTFTVTRSNVAAGAFTIDYATADGTALAGSDYTATSGTLSFGDNQVSATVTVAINNEGIPELDESFFLNLSNPTGATIADGQGVGTITNDDGAPIQVSINDVSIAEGNSGTSVLTFTVTRTGGTGAFEVSYGTADDSATAGSDYAATSGTLSFTAGQNTQTISVTIKGDLTPESTEQFLVNLTNPTNNAVIIDGQGLGTIANDEATYIHDIQGTAYFSPLLAGEGIHAFNIASTAAYTIRAVVTAVDNVGVRQGFYVSEEITDWDGNSFTSEGIFVMTRDDANVGTVVSGVAVGDLVEFSAHIMEYQAFSTMPRTVLVNPTGLSVVSSGNALPTVTLVGMPNEVLTVPNPDYFDSVDGAGDTFDASVYALSYFETVEGMLVTIPNMVVADGFVQTSGGDPYLQAYSLDSANLDQINSRGGYTIAGDPPFGPPDTPTTGDDTHNGGLVLHDGDVNPDIIELDFTDFATSAPSGLLQNATMGDLLGDITGIIDFDFTDRKLFVTSMEPGGFVDNGLPTQEVTVFGDDSRSLTVATFNVENLDPTDGAARFTALANAIANNLNSPDIISIEEMQDNNGAAGGDGTSGTGTDASTTWQMLVDALNLATGAHYQWVDEKPIYNAEGGEQSGNIRVGFLYNTDRVQLGDLDANATIAERRQYTDRIGDGVRDADDLIAYSDNMIASEINTADWANTRRSLLGEFTFSGNTVYVTANHLPSKGGSGEFWQIEQTGTEPNNSDLAQRSAVAQDVYTMLNYIQSHDADAGIVAGGDMNDFYFYRPLTTLTGYTMADGSERVGGARFDNLTLTLPEAERYTYTFDGRSQAIDHIIVNDLLAGLATYDVVHLNTGYNPNGVGAGADPALSDHDPGVATFDFRNLAETLAGTTGNDLILGFGGDDIIRAGNGNDVLHGGAGADRLEGEAGDDAYFVDSGDTVVEAAGQGFDAVYTFANYALAAGVEVEWLSAADNGAVTDLNLTGNELGQYVLGNEGRNIIYGGGGGDVLLGLGGDDTYFVDTGAAMIVEQASGGFDAVYTNVNYALGAGVQVEWLSALDNSGTGALSLAGNEIAQALVGNAGANVLNGGGGADLLYGGAGNDTYFVDIAGDAVFEAAGEGFDAVYATSSYTLGAGVEVEWLSAADNGATNAIDLTGNAFINYVLGNNGANVIDGGAGVDFLLGFGGADSFAFTTALGPDNIDVISDFTAGTDRIALDDAIFTELGGPGALNANAFVTGAAAADGSDRIIYNAATGQLFYDADGSGGGVAIHFATVGTNLSLAASDFMVI